LFKAVLFDFDGVLIDSMPFHVQAWQSVLNDYNIKIKPEEVLLNEGCRSVELAEKIFADWNYDISTVELKRFLENKQRRYQEITGAKFDEYAASFISKLKRRQVSVALVTGTSRANVNKVLSFEERNLFDAIITGDDVNKGKPDPESYLKAAQVLNVHPEDCIVVENAPLGIQAAKNAGMKVIALATTLDRVHLDAADFYFDDLQDLEKNWLGF
jgi:HAD superfamily hydrolase (TIGR01509 family)